MTQLQPLSNAITSFEELRREDAVYVDKTAFIATFLTSRAPVFISRPRRFGKSLLCSTLKSFFSHGIQFFKGLELEKWWNEQPDSIRQNLSGNAVLHLDFSVMKLRNVESFERAFKKNLAEAVRETCPDFEIQPDWDAEDVMSAFLSSRDPACVVLLIDEYDAPITHFLDKPHELWRVRGIRDDFYRMLKAQAEKLRFFFLTGISRVTKIGVFSGFNNVWDLTLSGNYATLLGYTEEELHRYFDPHIRHAAEVLQQTPEEIYAGLKENYDGFRFTCESEATLHNPWSVPKFLNEPGRGFVNYWYESGGLSTDQNSFFARSWQLDLTRLDTNLPCEEAALKGGVKLNIDDQAETVTPDYDPTMMLFQTGYLTLRGERRGPNGKLIGYLIGLPNQELRESLFSTLKERLNEALSDTQRNETDKIVEALTEGNLTELSTIFTCYLNSWDYDNSTLTSENACRGLIATWLQASGIDVITEAHSAGGRCDILLTLHQEQLRYAFEFKVQHQGENPDRRLEDALKQLVENDYGQVPPVSYELKKVGVVIGPDFRSIVKMTFVQ
ncbi:MAG: AAA family ATPase [Succinivibrio sp.]|nr:AAA family ATPase [Succinivibrio sp.]